MKIRATKTKTMIISPENTHRKMDNEITDRIGKIGRMFNFLKHHFFQKKLDKVEVKMKSDSWTFNK